MTVNSNRIQKDYYEGNNYGDYQFTSLDDIINQFLVVYVGEQKVINKASRTDVAFHAQRALQELSFDTLKSIKSQEIVLPPSLQMALPHDYVNYTNISWSDSSGIQHILYPTNKTSNPFKIKQDGDGNYDFSNSNNTISDFKNNDFSSNLSKVNDWTATPARINLGQKPPGSGTANPTNPNSTLPALPLTTTDVFNAVGGKLTATIHKEFHVTSGNTFGRHYSCWQAVNVTGVNEVNLSGLGIAPANITGAAGATIRLGISSTRGSSKTNPNEGSLSGQTSGESKEGPNFIPYTATADNLAYLEWVGGTTADSASKILESVNVSSYDQIFVLITMFVPGDLSNMVDATNVTLTLDDVDLTFDGVYNTLQEDGESTTWASYKATTPSENQKDDYDYDSDIYDLNIGQRYGVDPQYSQVNGSFYIDELKGLIHFSSNISGKTVILKYISDSLGTDSEMQVHKFAQEAMYKHIMYAILSAKANVPEYIVRRYKKEKFAATRQAKLRLSNIKLEEITQILRGKSKWIKH